MVVILLVEQYCASSREIAALLQYSYGFEWIDLDTYVPCTGDAGTVGLSSCHKYSAAASTPESQRFTKLDATITAESSADDAPHSRRHAKAVSLAADLLSKSRKDVVITRIRHTNELAILRKRPFVVAVNVDASPKRRFTIFQKRELSTKNGGTSIPATLEIFLDMDSLNGYGCCDCLAVLPTTSMEKQPVGVVSNPYLEAFGGTDSIGGTAACAQLCDFTIVNHSDDKDVLRRMLEKLQLTSPEIFRPSFDSHFMLIAFEMATRSNCIRRSVGVVITSNDRVIATGYNGTPSKYPNCLDGGCPRCADRNNGSGENLHNCICVHAEANALLQAGIDAALGGTLYTTSFPCLSCAKLIVQARIKRLVFATDYDDKTSVEDLFRKLPISIERHEPQLRRRAINLPLLSASSQHCN